ncbi:hypothetical protein [Metabacillus niabensis]|uniref:Uncharacterized protein n=1 Tax=Metabacillus niabensis TaxID=324854 RepID=A0ABT9YWY7_9BACI|nr:hypothetical protein [Metabacillus niabensis]MDQ0224122.1 hypothetical protein [Metabacillus niabensis]
MTKASFSKFVESIYRKHDRIQSEQDTRIEQITTQLEEIDKKSVDFEKRMESIAEDIGQWLIKHEFDKK